MRHTQIHTEKILTIDLLQWFQDRKRIQPDIDWMEWVESAQESLESNLPDWLEKMGINPDGCIWFRFYEKLPSRWEHIVKEALEAACEQNTNPEDS